MAVSLAGLVAALTLFSHSSSFEVNESSKDRNIDGLK